MNAETEVVIDEPSMTIDGFCLAERISHAHYYKLQRNGLAPVTIRLLSAVRITARARRQWQDRMANLTKQETAQLERKRRVEGASRAGKIAAKSPNHYCRRGRSAANK
jgi:hypothetical protein